MLGLEGASAGRRSLEVSPCGIVVHTRLLLCDHELTELRFGRDCHALLLFELLDVGLFGVLLRCQDGLHLVQLVVKLSHLNLVLLDLAVLPDYQFVDFFLGPSEPF